MESKLLNVSPTCRDDLDGDTLVDDKEKASLCHLSTIGRETGQEERRETDELHSAATTTADTKQTNNHQHDKK